jgi:DNA-binding MarR family transcriptional regulator
MDTSPEICSCAALRQAARHVTRLYDDALAPTQLSLNQYSILAKLDRFGANVLQDLARILVMDRSTLGHLIRPLEQRGLIAIGMAAQDRRHRIISITPAGADLLERARTLWAGAEQRFGEAFGPDAAANLRLLLKQVTVTELPRGVSA